MYTSCAGSVCHCFQCDGNCAGSPDNTERRLCPARWPCGIAYSHVRKDCCLEASFPLCNSIATSLYRP